MKDHETEIKMEIIREREFLDMLKKLTSRPNSKFANQVDEFHRMVIERT